MAPKPIGRSTKSRAQAPRDNARKRPASALSESIESIQKKKLKSIISVVAGAEELPAKVRQSLSGLVSGSLSLDDGLPAPYRHAVMSMVGEALMNVEEKLEMQLSEAQEKAKNALEDQATCDVAAVEAEARLNNLRSIVAESKAAIRETRNSIETSRNGLKTLQAAQKTSLGKVDAMAAQVDKLLVAENNAFRPLKEAAAQGRKGNAQLKCIQKLGKDFGFPEALLESVPAVLKKELDRRQTFDGFVMDQLEREFMKHVTAMGTQLKAGEEELKEQSHLVKVAQVDADEKNHTRDACNKSLSEALAALAPSKKALTLARQNARKFMLDAKKYEHDVVQAQVRLDAFRSGALTAFRELKELAPEAIAASSYDTIQQPQAFRRNVSS